MKRLHWCCIALTLVLAGGAFAAEADTIKLFDGKTLEGWNGDKDLWRVEDGAIVGGSLDKPVKHNDFLCTEAPFENFELRYKIKLVGKDPNAGVQIRSKRVPDSHEVSGYQADAGQQYWGCLYDEARRNKLLACPEKDVQKKAVDREDWNDYRVRCEGPRIQLWINGQQTVDYTEEEADIPRKGIIGLQVHAGAPSEAWYKDIVLQKLPDGE